MQRSLIARFCLFTYALLRCRDSIHQQRITMKLKIHFPRGNCDSQASASGDLGFKFTITRLVSQQIIAVIKSGLHLDSRATGDRFIAGAVNVVMLQWTGNMW